MGLGSHVELLDLPRRLEGSGRRLRLTLGRYPGNFIVGHREGRDTGLWPHGGSVLTQEGQRGEDLTMHVAARLESELQEVCGRVGFDRALGDDEPLGDGRVPQARATKPSLRVRRRRVQPSGSFRRFGCINRDTMVGSIMHSRSAIRRTASVSTVGSKIRSFSRYPSPPGIRGTGTWRLRLDVPRQDQDADAGVIRRRSVRRPRSPRWSASAASGSR